MDRKGYITLVLPGRELIKDYEPTDNLLKSMGTSVKEVIEMYINAWAEYKSVELHGYSYDYIRGSCHYNRDHPAVIELSIQARWLVTDIIMENAYKRLENGEVQRIDTKDMRDGETVLMSLWHSLSEYIFELIGELRVADEQISYLRFVGWTGDDFIVSLPRITSMHVIHQEEEKEHVEKLRAASPLCNHHRSHWS